MQTSTQHSALSTQHLTFCVEGRPNERLVNFLRSLGMVQAEQNLITAAELVVIGRPASDHDRDIIELAHELGKRVIVINPLIAVKLPVDVFRDIDLFETSLRREVEAEQKAVTA